MTPHSPPAGDRLEDIFVGNSEMARLMREHDWASTPLGPPRQWPQTLKVALRLLLTSRFEMWLGWGEDVRFFYNDAYRPTLGMKHPRSLGMPTRELWAEIWDQIRDRIETVYRKGEATWDRALPLVLHRSGYPEETYHTFSYSPLIGDTGRVEGLFCAVSEETNRVISERRLAALQDLAARLAGAATRAEVFQAAQAALTTANKDLPFSMLYLPDAHGVLQRAFVAGLDEAHPVAPAQLAGASTHPWHPPRLRDEPQLVPLDGWPGLPTGGWDVPPSHAVILPIAQGPDEPVAGAFIAGLNPYRPAREDVLRYARSVANQLEASLATVTAYEQQAAERDRLRSAFELAPSFFCILSGPEHRFELANPSYRRLVGGREIEGRTLEEALPEIRGQGFVELLDDVYRSGEPHVGRGVAVELSTPGQPDTTTHYLDFVYQPVRNAQGAVTGIFVEGYDVTEQVKAEQALRTLNASLETRIEARTRDLARALDDLRRESREREHAEEALRHAHKMEALGQLTGGIAHDFNNMLQGITGALDLIRLKARVGQVGDLDNLVSRAMQSAHRAAGMTHRLLAFSRRQPLDPKPVDTNQLLKPMSELLRRTIGERIGLELSLAPDAWPTLCDAGQLESAILNLCINARDAMPDGGVITLATRNVTLAAAEATQVRSRPGDYLCISIEDTGEGMTPDVLEKAFDPFFTTKPIGQGTGLGLSMVYGFVNQSQGFVKLDSEPGRGTEVRLYLPRFVGQADGAESSGGEHPPTAARQSGEVILVAEDDAVVRSLIVEVLGALGYSIVEAADGAEALQVLEGDARIDLLVSDVGLPVLNGRQVYDAALARRPRLKVLFMTGYAEHALAQGESLRPGMELITKPFAMDKLAARVREMTARADAARAA